MKSESRASGSPGYEHYEDDLDWTGGVSPYTVRRSQQASFSGPVSTLVDEQAINTHADPVLEDGLSYYYLVD